MRWLLGLSLGDSKLQVAVGRGDGTPFRTVLRESMEPGGDASTLLLQLAVAIQKLLTQAKLDRGQIAGVGCGFRGPVDHRRGVTLGGPHGHSWDQLPLVEWFKLNFEWPAVICRDVEAAALAESTWGAGHGFDPLLYVHAGSQICGALVQGTEVYRGSGQAGDIGHLRPGNAPRHVSYPATVVNALASGTGIVERGRRVIADWEQTQKFIDGQFALPATAGAAATSLVSSPPERFSTLLRLTGASRPRLSVEMLAQAASQGDRLSRELLADATEALGWGVAQAVTLFHPARVVIGGGLSRLGLEHFFEPLRRTCRAEVSPQLTAGWKASNDGVCATQGSEPRRPGGLEIVPGTLGDSAVLHGALQLAKRTFLSEPSLRVVSSPDSPR